MRKAIYIFMAATLFAATGAKAQNHEIYGGYLMTRHYLPESDLASMSQYNPMFGTARSAAMGGAFTSLGADLYAMSLNPAGLGMYQSSEFSLTPTISFGKMESRAGGVSMDGGNKTRFAFNNIGTALNVYQSSGTLTSFTFGFAYNKLADYNYKSRIGMTGNRFSIADVFTRQLRGIDPNDLLRDRPWYNYDIGVGQWGAVLGYKTYLLDSGDGGANYYVTGFGDNTDISNMLQVNSKGSIGEYNFSGGFNLVNKVYLGFSFSFLNIYRKQSVMFSESYSGDFGDIPLEDYISGMDYGQYTRIYGYGFNMKFGAIYRPIPELRLGVAVHTPTWTSIDTEYGASMASHFPNRYPGTEATSNPQNVKFEYDYRTPTRLMFGASYTFAGMGIISFDYERTWYDKTRLNDDDPWLESYYRQYFDDNFKAANTFRVGLEVLPTRGVSLRAGYARSDSFLRNDYSKDAPIPYEWQNISGGVGFLLGNQWSLDLAYVYSKTKFTDCELFVYMDNNLDFRPAYEVRSEMKRHNIMATLSYRF